MKFISNSNYLAKYLDLSLKKNIDIKNISIDTRTLKKGSLFIAIKGDNFNGNDYIDEALKKGASLAVVNKFNSSEKINKQIKVKDTLKFLSKVVIKVFVKKLLSIFDEFIMLVWLSTTSFIHNPFLFITAK